MWLFFFTQYNSSLSSFVPNLRILTQIVAEKSLTEKNVYMYYIRVKERKNEKEGKMKKVNKQCLLDTPRTVRVSEKT